MRKYVVPIVALAGIALLSPSANAANLIIKSRAGSPGRPVSLPVAATAVGGSTQLWGLDFALTFDTTKLSAGNDATYNAAFTPAAVGTSTEVPVVVSGTPSVGTGATNPNLYVGIVRGTSAFTTTAGGNGAPSSSIGLLRLQVAAGATVGTVVPLTVPTGYNVANTGDGSTTNNRAGATGATSTATAGDPVVAEAISTLDYMPGATAPTGSNPDLRVPLHQVAVGKPGDLNANSGIDAADAGNLYAVLVNKAAASWTPYKRIVADIAPLNGYTAANIGGSNGLGYGDGSINAADAGLMSAKLVNKPAAANFPVAE